VTRKYTERFDTFLHRNRRGFLFRVKASETMHRALDLYLHKPSVTNLHYAPDAAPRWTQQSPISAVLRTCGVSKIISTIVQCPRWFSVVAIWSHKGGMHLNYLATTAPPPRIITARVVIFTRVPVVASDDLSILAVDQSPLALREFDVCDRWAGRNDDGTERARILAFRHVPVYKIPDSGKSKPAEAGFNGSGNSPRPPFLLEFVPRFKDTGRVKWRSPPRQIGGLGNGTQRRM
jgi:hypothetical protein